MLNQLSYIRMLVAIEVMVLIEDMASAQISVSGIPEPLSGKFKESFAYVTIKDRLPIILTKVIDSLHRERHNIGIAFGEPAKEETKSVIGRLSELRNEMVTNKPIVALRSNAPDVSLWNEYLKSQEIIYGFPPAWFDSPWLYSECYLYRRIKEAFELSSHLQSYDPFRLQKESAFFSSVSDATLLASTLQQAANEIGESENSSEIYEYFVKFVEISLWGNKCDLSISVGTDSYQSSQTNSFAHLENLRKNIIVNDTESIWQILQSANHKHKGAVRIDIVLDNAGFELFTDLCLLEFLEAAKLIDEVHLYLKVIPWFVSDTLISDFNWLLRTLAAQKEEVFINLAKRWTDKINNRKWIIEEEKFWTLPHDYSEMREIDLTLYNHLSESDLIVFKGDLNYRKLTSDRKWNVDTPFRTSLRGFLPAPLCVLRTIKADVVTGMPLSVKEELDKTVSNWMVTGEYAVIQCVQEV